MVWGQIGSGRIVTAVTRLRAHRHRGDVHLGIVIRERVEARVVAERPLAYELLPRIHVALEHELRLGRDLEVARNRLGEPDRLLAQEPGEQELVDRGRERRGGGVHRRRIAAQGDRHGHPLPPRRHLAPMRRPHLVPLPVHRQLVRADDLDAVHPHVAHARLRVACDDTRHREIGAAVLGPAHRDRELRQIDVPVPHDDLLGRRASADRFGWELRDLGELGKHGQLAQQGVGDLDVEERRDPPADLVEARDAQGERHALLGAEQVDCDRVARRPALE